MRKQLLMAGALIILTAGPAAADMVSSKMLQRSIGAPVYDLNDFYVGRISGYVLQFGTPSAIVALNGPSKDVAIALQTLGPRQKGGRMVALKAGNIMGLHRWFPGSSWSPG